ncbi:tetratricopeptide repeat protein [Alkalihalobacillus sp. MEB130]|uniref:tetratricopeptide repeat protein n=1 Tax=Alkalihalobacillus sp. MEB130 TaxID=2976704 RepID=UPI0028E0478B|nr:tetratricopeptide repeat protein [Alkalihalobacillus sp. MEB130]MDT8859999.1 tetratricopeptide repeat protein [Alkalihalobacillus sp. MEB130]
MNVLKQVLHDIESGHVKEGLEQLSRLEKQADHQMKHEIAELYHELGHVEKAKKIVDDLLALYPDEGGLYTFAAELLIDMDEEDEAIEMLQEIKKEDPAFLQAQLLLADLYQMQSLDEVAEQKLLLAAKVAPDEVIISYGLGEFYLERGDYLKSIPFLKKAVHAKESIPNVHIELLLADAYSASGQFEEALQYYAKGLKNHLDPNALFGYGFTAYQVGDMILAIEQLEALRALDPDYSSLYPYLAKALEAEGRLDDAFETLEKGLKVDEYNETLYIHAAKLSFKRQNPEDGEALLRKVIALNPSNVEAVQTLAAYLKHSESFDELSELMDHMREYGEEDSMYTWYEATALKELDDYEKAYERYKEIEQTFEEDHDFLEEYGYFLLEYGMRDQAIKYFQKLRALQPERMDIVQLLENLQ